MQITSKRTGLIFNLLLLCSVLAGSLPLRVLKTDGQEPKNIGSNPSYARLNLTPARTQGKTKEKKQNEEIS
jgi:hypothetical protein